MNDSKQTRSPAGLAVAPVGVALPADQSMAKVATLLATLEPQPRPAMAAANLAYENHLVEVRLGLASSLFHALRCKHAATASHSLRVALGCSSWALALGMPDHDRENLEVAALLHDVGKIGVPDAVLLKPGKLLPEQAIAMDRHHTCGLEILHGCCASATVLDIVRCAPAWFDGNRCPDARTGQRLPLGARILAIVDAFDSMTTDHVYRPASSRERAMHELFQCAGTQFDPDLVKSFQELQHADQTDLDHRVAGAWLLALDPAAMNARWHFNPILTANVEALPAQALYQQKLLDNMYDGVMFLDANLQVVLWNRGAERMTGISGSSMLQRPFSPNLFHMRDERGMEITDADCPVAYAVNSKVQSMRRMIISGRNGRDVAVDLQTVPVTTADGTTHGATLLLHDVSEESSLEQRCQKLHERSIKDPLTQLANRAEFDRVLRMFVEVHLQRSRPCAMIICDIDRFKQVNDIYGHQAGDEVIKSFAAVLKSFCGPGDLAARYGGEEFVLLCADCNNASAASRADEVRQAFAGIPHEMLGGRRISASFGVTEIQSGDTPETMLCRADRALLQAKDTGRNRVVQLGTGIGESAPTVKRRWWPWLSRQAEALFDVYLVTGVPLAVAIEKLRGFVADHRGEVSQIDNTRVHLTIQGQPTTVGRRQSDRQTPFAVELHFSEERVKSTHSGVNNMSQLRTKIHVTIRPKRHRDRRRADAAERAKQLLSSLRSYLMAVECDNLGDLSGQRPPSDHASRK